MAFRIFVRAGFKIIFVGGGIDQSCFSALDSKLFNAEGQFKVTLFTHVFFFKNKDSSNKEPKRSQSKNPCLNVKFITMF